MVRDPNYDRYAGITSLEDPVNPRKRRPFRVDEDGNVIYRDVLPGFDGRSNPAGILGWDELDRRLDGPLEPAMGDIVATAARGSAAGNSGRVATTRKTIDGIDYDVISANSFDPALSNGVTAIPSIGLMSAAIADKDKVAVPYGTDEKGGYLRREPAFSDYDMHSDAADGLRIELRDEPRWATVDDVAIGNDGIYINRSGLGSYVTVPALNAKTKDVDDANTLDFDYPRSFPQGTDALSHGHIDNGPTGWNGQPVRSDGMVDAPSKNGGFGDATSLQISMPMATVSGGKVGWHTIENGQLRFMYPAGALNPDQVKSIQANLNREQKKFHRK